MITSDLNELPRASLASCQKYHFPKIQAADIVHRLQRICIDEALDFDQEGLHFIAARSNGSLRDAETLLDQLGLLGKKITVSLVHELVGSVSDDELIELLDLALASDTTNTVRRARELMSSAVDPLQLVSQLANLIMDILSGRCQSGLTDISKNFFSRYASAELGMLKLRHALRVLSEAEKQLRTSKNQATWVTVALLQFSTGEPSLLAEAADAQSHSVATSYTDDWVSKVNSNTDICHACSRTKSNCSEKHCRRLKLESIWRRAVDKCRTRSVRSFLRKEGFLMSVHVTEELAIAEVGFSHPDQLGRAEKLQNALSSSLQLVLGCSVEVRFRLVPRPNRRDVGARKQPFSLLNCSGRKQELSDSAMTELDETARSGQSPYTKNTRAKQAHCDCGEETRSTSVAMSSKSTPGGAPKIHRLEADGNGMEECLQEPELQPSCFSRTLRLQKRFFSGDSAAAHTICLRIQPQSKMELSIPRKAFETYFRKYEPYEQYSRSTSHVTCSSRDETFSTKNSRRGSMLCWKGPKHST